MDFIFNKIKIYITREIHDQTSSRNDQLLFETFNGDDKNRSAKMELDDESL